MEAFAFEYRIRMLLYFSHTDYYCNDRFSASVFSSRGILKLATQNKLQKYFGKRILPAIKPALPSAILLFCCRLMNFINC